MVPLTEHRTPKGESGSVLILSLWILALLALLSGSLAYRTRLECQLTQYQWDEIRLIQLAKMAVFDAADIWRHQTGLYAAFSQTWNDNSERFKDHPLPGGFYTASHENCYGLEDEASKLNVNNASAAVLNRLFEGHKEVVPEILAWRSGSGLGSDTSGETGQQVVTARHGPLKSVEELLLVPRMTPEIYWDVAADLTVYTDGGVNVNTASERVLLALGLSSSLVNKILEFRRGRDNRTGTEDDGVFKAVESVLPDLRTQMRVTDTESQLLTALLQKRLLTVQSGVVRINFVTRLPGRPIARRFTVVAAAQAVPPQILFWREVY